MSGFTPRTLGDEPTGLQDVLAFIADFEMEDNVSDDHHDVDEWMEDEGDSTEQQTSGKVYDSNLENLFMDGGRRPTPTAANKSSGSCAIETNQPLLLSTNALGLPSTSLPAGDSDSNASATKATRRHRVSRKEELEYLRRKVTEMEDKLQALKDNAEDGHSPPLPPPAALTPESEKAAMQLKQSVALWKKMAERQKNQRELVESENMKLRDKLKTQIRMAKSLQQILRKRERAAEQVRSLTCCGVLGLLYAYELYLSLCARR